MPRRQSHTGRWTAGDTACFRFFCIPSAPQGHTSRHVSSAATSAAELSATAICSFPPRTWHSCCTCQLEVKCVTESHNESCFAPTCGGWCQADSSAPNHILTQGLADTTNRRTLMFQRPVLKNCTSATAIYRPRPALKIVQHTAE